MQLNAVSRGGVLCPTGIKIPGVTVPRTWDFCTEKRWGQLRKFYQRPVNALEGGAAGERHGQFEFGPQQLQHVADAFRAIYGQSPENRAANQDGSRTKSQGLEHVCPAAYAAIDENLAAPGNGLDNFRKSLDARQCGIQLPTTVIGDDDAGGALAQRYLRILRRQDTLNQDGQGCYRS